MPGGSDVMIPKPSGIATSIHLISIKIHTSHALCSISSSSFVQTQLRLFLVLSSSVGHQPSRTYVWTLRRLELASI